MEGERCFESSNNFDCCNNFAEPNHMRTLPSTMMLSLLVAGVGASSLKVAMAHIKEEAGFDPKEPPQHKTDIKVGLYLEHLLDVSAFSAPSTPSAHLHTLR